MNQSNQIGCGATPNREPAVFSALSDVAYEVERLEVLAGQLIGRLSPVVRTILDKATEEGCAKDPTYCELSGRLVAQANNLRRIQAALNETLQALEI